MERAPWPVGLLFGLGLAVVILLAGPLLLFNPPFVYLLQDRHEVAEQSFEGMHDRVDAVTLSLLVDIYFDGPFDASLDGGEPLLDADERSHMSDVSRLVRLLAGITIVALIVVGVAAAWLRREPRRQGRIMLIAAGSIGGGAILLAGIFAVAFEPAFLFFHELFFPPGTYLFPTGSDLIRLFPQGFWFDAALAAGASIVLVALVVTLIGFRRWRAASPTVERA